MSFWVSQVVSRVSRLLIKVCQILAVQSTSRGRGQKNNYMYAKFYGAQGGVEDVVPANGKWFTYAELTKFVGGMVEIVPMPSGRQMVVNEEGKLKSDWELEINDAATKVWKEEYPIAQYPNNNDELIVGNALVCDESLLEGEEE